MYLGIDLGTSGIKALLIDDDQVQIASANAPLDVSRPHPGWSEQAPGDWIAATEAAVGKLRSSHRKELAAVRGIGLSGQMHGATLLDGADQPLRPCILWNDTRAHAEAAEMDGVEAFRRITGNIVFPGFTAPKLRWVRRNEPENFGRVRWVLLPKDYLRLWLTGEHISEMSDSAGTSWLNTDRRRWSGELLDETDLQERQMPDLVEGSEIGGKLRPELATAWGMAPDVVVAGGAGDNAATACGMGALGEGQAFVSLGTSGVLFAANDSFRPLPASAVHTFCHALPGKWHQMGVILAATDSLNWLATIAGTPVPQLIAELGDELRAAGPAVFLPYVSGERTPHNDAAIRGAFAGLDRGGDRKALTRAVLEGVAFALRDNLDALAAAGTRLTRVMAVGGGSNSRLWLEMIATALDIAVDVPAEGDFGAALGAARLGLVAASGAEPSTVCTPPAIARSIEPNRRFTQSYQENFARYRALYPAIKGAMA